MGQRFVLDKVPNILIYINLARPQHSIFILIQFNTFLIPLSKTQYTKKMYAQNNNSFYDDSSDFINQNYPSGLTPPLLQSRAGDFDSMNEAFVVANANANMSTGSRCTSNSYIGSPTSPLSYTSSHPPNSTASLMQRSLSSHSLQKNGFQLPVSTPASLLDLEIGPVRRVFSTGDLDQVIVQVTEI